MLIQEEHAEASAQQAQRMAQLHTEWLADLQRLGEFHQQAVEMLRSEQTSAIEHWKTLQIAEIDAVKEAGSNARSRNFFHDHLIGFLGQLFDVAFIFQDVRSSS